MPNISLENIVQSEVFFFITSIAVVVVTIMISIVSIYAIKILQDIRQVVRDMKSKYEYLQKIINYLTK